MFKKIAISSFVVMTFVIYSIHQRGEGVQAVSQLGTNKSNTTSNLIPFVNSSPTPSPSTSSSPASTGMYKDGSYTGKSGDAYYGYIKVKAVISGGKLTDVQFLDYPQDRGNSIEINQYAMPVLKDQAIKAQTAQVDGVSGATDSSQAFVESLSDALAQARA